MHALSSNDRGRLLPQHLGGIRATVALAVMWALCGCQAPRVESERELDLRSFDVVWHTVRDQHFDPRLGGVDWDGLYIAYRPRVERAATRRQVRFVMRELLSHLGQSHFQILHAEWYDDGVSGVDRGARDGGTGLSVRILGGQAVVAVVEEDSAAADAGIGPGWVLTAVAGRALQPWLQRVAGDDPMRSSSELEQVLDLTAALRGPVGRVVPLTLVDAEDRVVRVELALRQRRGRKSRVGDFPPQFVRFEARTIDGDIGYIAFDGFYDPEHLVATFDDAVDDSLDAAGLILDLRGNGGGISDLAAVLAGRLFDERNRALGTMHTRRGERRFEIVPRRPVYAGPLAVVVDGLTASTAEILAAGVQDLGRARIFGTTTAGSAQPSRALRLPNGDGLQYATANFVSDAGDVIEGVGVYPDGPAPLTRAALLSGRDPALEAAVAWIRAGHRGGRGSGR